MNNEHEWLRYKIHSCNMAFYEINEQFSLFYLPCLLFPKEWTRLVNFCFSASVNDTNNAITGIILDSFCFFVSVSLYKTRPKPRVQS